MRKLNNFWFGAIFTLSIVFVIWCFNYADSVRGYDGMGGEVFMIALPLMIVWNKIKTMGQKIDRLKKYNRILQNHI